VCWLCLCESERFTNVQKSIGDHNCFTNDSCGAHCDEEDLFEGCSKRETVNFGCLERAPGQSSSIPSSTQSPPVSLNSIYIFLYSNIIYRIMVDY
jgi:hypothetical protein